LEQGDSAVLPRRPYRRAEPREVALYAFIFGQNGLMAGLGIEGSKITKT
jgi:hypothetical protein